MIVTLCGSTRFGPAYKACNILLSLYGNVVLSVSVCEHYERFGITEEEKNMFDHLHFRKIDASQAIFVIDASIPMPRTVVDNYAWWDEQHNRSLYWAGYVGLSTLREICWANHHQCLVFHMSSMIRDGNLPVPLRNRQLMMLDSDFKEYDEAEFRQNLVRCGIVE